MEIGKDGEKRGFLEDGDTVVMRGWAEKKDNGVRIGFGECKGMVRPALEDSEYY